MSDEVQRQLEEWADSNLRGFPYSIVTEDWSGNVETRGGREPHWRREPLVVRIRTVRAARRLLKFDLLGFLEAYLNGDVDLEGNLYLMPDLRKHLGAKLVPGHHERQMLGIIDQII